MRLAALRVESQVRLDEVLAEHRADRLHAVTWINAARVPCLLHHYSLRRSSGLPRSDSRLLPVIVALVDDDMDSRLLGGGGTIVDATLIAAPPSTKNEDKARDPEMHQVKKGNQWHFGMKIHVGTDSKTGLVHSASITAANVHDSHEVPNLLHGDETRFYGDSAYRGKAQRERLKEIAPNAKDFTNKRAYRNAPLSDADKEANRRKSSIRAKVEHPFLILKRLWGFAKVRYRGLAKNANRAFAMLAAINILRHGRPLTGEVRPA